jgi:putative oxidoreductase
MNTIWGKFVDGRAAWGLLVVRLVFGAALTLHGVQKMSSPFGWMGADSSVPGVLQFLAFLSEFGGGLAILFGLLTPLASLGVAITMIVAMVMVHASHPFVSASGPSKEGAATYLAVALLMLLSGPGTLSLDWLLLGRGRKQGVQ